MIYYIIGGILWVICGVLAWGFQQGAYKVSCYNWSPPFIFFAIFLCLFGPASLFAVFVVDGVEHWSWKPITRQERWKIYKEKYAILVAGGHTYENFDK